MKLITISGLDGSGKTTQVQMLKEYLEKQDYKTKYFHAVQFSIANKVLVREYKGKIMKEKPIAVVKAGFFQIFLRKIALIIDVFRFRKYFIMLARDAEIDFLLADRCFCDQTVNIFYLENKFELLSKPPFWFKLVEKYAITPDLKMYLKTSPDLILTRNKKLEQNRQYLTNKEKIYHWLSERWHLKIINGHQDKALVFKDILLEYKNIDE